MKRIWFGAVLLAVLLVLGFGSSALMERVHLSQAEDLTKAADFALVSDWSAAERLLSDARGDWDEKRLFIAALSDHEPMDQIDGLFAQLEVFAQTRDATAFSGTCVYLAQQLEALGKSHSFNLQNFF